MKAGNTDLMSSLISNAEAAIKRMIDYYKNRQAASILQLRKAPLNQE